MMSSTTGDDIPKSGSIIGRKESVQNGIQTRIAIGQTIGKDLERHWTIFVGIHAKGFEKQNHLHWYPADGKDNDDDDNHSGDSDFVFFALARIFVSHGSGSVGGCRAFPKAYKHVEIEA